MKKLENIIAAISIALVLWVGISTAEVMAKNTHPNPEYSNWNAFEVLDNWTANS